MNKRTVRDFQMGAELWPAVDKWAKETGYRLNESSDTMRLYQKGAGVLVAPMMLKLTQQANNVHLEAWVRISRFVRIMSLLLLPAEMGIEPGGFKGVAPRAIARTAINKLFIMINQPVIQ